jgi:predicted DNA-binding WGR domain protein
MKVRLEKKNRVTTSFIQMEVEGHSLTVHNGKIGKSGIAKSNKHCGTNDKAIKELNEIKQEYLSKKYIEVKVKRPLESNKVYDKAKWHFRGDFPEELDIFQGYVHTGFYLTWIIEKDFFNPENDELLIGEVEKIKTRKITGAKFFEENLDGVFLEEDLTEKGNNFTYEYYEKGEYLDDYNDILGEELPTLYHIEDNWSNYDKLKPILEKRFKKWEKSKQPKWWKRK